MRAFKQPLNATISTPGANGFAYLLDSTRWSASIAGTLQPTSSLSSPGENSDWMTLRRCVGSVLPVGQPVTALFYTLANKAWVHQAALDTTCPAGVSTALTLYPATYGANDGMIAFQAGATPPTSLTGTGTVADISITQATLDDIPAGEIYKQFNPAALDATGGTVTGLTKLGVRDTSAAFDVDIAATSSTALTAKRTLTFDMGNADRTLTLPVSSTTTLTGEVTGSGSGSFATTIAAGAVTLAKQANLAANSLQGNNTGSPATPLALTVAQVKVLLGYVLAPSTQSGNTYTPVLADQDRPVQMTYAGASAVTLPQDSDLAFPVGGVIPFKCANAAGKITFAAGSGATMTVARVGCASLIPQNPWGVIYKSAANTWELIGPFVG